MKLRTGTYIRKIAVEGKIIFYDIKQFDDLRHAFNRIGSGLNQIAKVVNSTHSVFEKDIEDLKKLHREFKSVLDNYLLLIKSKILFEEE